MYTRKRKGKRRKTKRGGLGTEVYMMTGLLTALNGIMMSFGPLSGSFDPCNKEAPVAEATVVDDSVPVAKSIDDPIATPVDMQKYT
jgi:hypothetical protein